MKFHQLSTNERLRRIVAESDLTASECAALSNASPLPVEIAEQLIENAVGYFQLPLGVATHLVIDGRKLLVPMAVEETSIIAAVSSTAKWVGELGGTVTTKMKGNLIIGQIQIAKLARPEASVARLQDNKAQLVERANYFAPGLVARGGGIRDIQFRIIPREDCVAQMLVIHVLCDPKDAMGANVINQVCEGLKPEIEALTGEKVAICILSNLVDEKLATAEVRVPGIAQELGEGIQEASLFAEHDPYRAATHNKGVMNGIDPIMLATGNDWRAVEAGAHAYASRDGRYKPLTLWRYAEGTLRGTIELPMAVGTVGGMTAIHPQARAALKLLRVERAEDLGRICAAVGLVQNLGALRALTTVGIVRGHMQLHAKNLALAAGATLDESDDVATELKHVLLREKRISTADAREAIQRVRERRQA